MLLSIIVPIYNAEKYLPRCLDSLLNQGLGEDEMEIVCVDDGSTDGSLSVLRGYEERCSCVRVFSQENHGAWAARNRGLDEAKGDVVTFCDADDYLIPDGLGYVMRTFWNDDVDVICHASTTLDRNKLKTWKENNVVDGSVICEGEGKKIYERDPKYFVWNTIIRRSIIEELQLRFLPLTMSEDSTFMLELMMSVSKAIDVSSNIYRYTVSEGQVTRQRDPKTMRTCIDNYLHFMSELKKYNQENVIQIQKRPLFSRAFSACLSRKELSELNARLDALNIKFLPYPVYVPLSFLFRKIFVPFVLPHISRG